MTWKYPLKSPLHGPVQFRCHAKREIAAELDQALRRVVGRKRRESLVWGRGEQRGIARPLGHGAAGKEGEHQGSNHLRSTHPHPASSVRRSVSRVINLY